MICNAQPILKALALDEPEDFEGFVEKLSERKILLIKDGEIFPEIPEYAVRNGLPNFAILEEFLKQYQTKSLPRISLISHCYIFSCLLISIPLVRTSTATYINT